MALNILAFDSSTNRVKRTATVAPDYRAGRQAVTNGSTSVNVTFSSAIASTNYSVICVWQNTVDSNPQFQQVVVTALSTTGFTATWNVPVDSANYSLNWHVPIFS